MFKYLERHDEEPKKKVRVVDYESSGESSCDEEGHENLSIEKIQEEQDTPTGTPKTTSATKTVKTADSEGPGVTWAPKTIKGFNSWLVIVNGNQAVCKCEYTTVKWSIYKKGLIKS